MFKKLFNKLMSNKEQNNNTTVEPTSPDETFGAEVSANENAVPADAGVAVEVESTSQSEMPGIEVPAGPQVPGVDMTQDVPADITEKDSQVSDNTSEPTQEEGVSQAKAADPIIPAENN